jgi:hypothetical protein
VTEKKIRIRQGRLTKGDASVHLISSLKNVTL